MFSQSTSVVFALSDYVDKAHNCEWVDNSRNGTGHRDVVDFESDVGRDVFGPTAWSTEERNPLADVGALEDFADALESGRFGYEELEILSFEEDFH